MACALHPRWVDTWSAGKKPLNAHSGLTGSEGEYLCLLMAATQHAKEHQEYLDSTQVQVMTGPNAKRENTREEYRAGEP